MHFDAIEAVGGGPEQVQSAGGAVKVKKFKVAASNRKSRRLRTTTEAEFWECDGDIIPFGLAKWTAKTTVEKRTARPPVQTPSSPPPR